MKAVRKPAWLKRETFEALLAQNSPLPQCRECGAVDDLTVDHITPRYFGGLDTIDNLQFLCRSHNSAKGIRPDSHWSRSFYWDQRPDDQGWLRLREGQRNLFEDIVDANGEYFSRPIGEIARFLYVAAMVVGAGKTVSIAVATWALNYLILKTRGTGCRRADRILVLAKEIAVRDQLARDLAADLVRLGIVTRAPRVGVVTQGDQFTQPAWLDEHDIIVSCVEQLWESKGAARPDLGKILAEFPVIHADEPHFAHEQMDRIVDAASSSIVLGYTSTPIDGAGILLQRMVLLSLYTYQNAIEHDRSLKYLDATPENFYSWFVRELDIHDASIIDRGSLTIAESTEREGYEKNIEPAKAVVRALIEEMRARDDLVMAHEIPAPHRDQPDVRMGLHFPVHTIVYCDSIVAAEELCKNTNNFFDQNRGSWPKERGWQGLVVHAGTEKFQAKPLTPNHPWTRCYRNDGRLDANCARIVFCVGMVREGINHPYTSLIGVAGSFESILAAVQGWIGRQCRAVTWLSEGILMVPPAPLDRIRIITHKAYKNNELIKRALEFVYNMRGELSELRTISDLDDGGFVEPEKINRAMSLSYKDRINIAGFLHEQKENGVDVTIDEVLSAFPPSSEKRAKRIREWVDAIRQEDKSSLRKELRMDRTIGPVPVVLNENLRYVATDEELERFARSHYPDLLHVALPLDERTRPLLAQMKKDHDKTFQHPPLLPSTTLSKLSRSLGFDVKLLIGKWATTALDDNTLYGFSTSAVRQKLGVPQGVRMKDTSNWNTPQSHAIIRRPEVRTELIGWIIGRLIDKGFCPSLQVFAAE